MNTSTVDYFKSVRHTPSYSCKYSLEHKNDLSAAENSALTNALFIYQFLNNMLRTQCPAF